MAIQDIKLGTQPSGAGGDTNRSANVKTNENFTNPLHAASRMVGDANGNLVEAKSGLYYSSKLPTFTAGIGGSGLMSSQAPRGKHGAGDDVGYDVINGFYSQPSGSLDAPAAHVSGDTAIVASWANTFSGKLFFSGYRSAGSLFFRFIRNGTHLGWNEVYHTANTTKDSNGFLKAASPVVKLFANKIDPNAEAAEQNPIFKKVGIGHYLIKGTQGFATEGWWIEVPADTNGNKICAVQYQTLENGDLEIKTFKKKLNDEGDIVPNLDAPIDIPNNTNGEPRWIDIRLNPLPAKPIVEQVPRTEKRPKMVKQIKYAPQLTYITKMQDLIDDEGNPVIIKGQPFQAPVSYVHTDQNGTPILTSQPVINDNGENVFELVQEIDLDGQPVFEDVPVLDADGNQIFDEVTHGPEQ
ncbi:hypothetical protein [Acinetobacter rudis]|uniref:phage tail fiber protein n=1 Tax=Acinetobacter rudis TaxID=632955 RepID=UPI00334211B2